MNQEISQKMKKFYYKGKHYSSLIDFIHAILEWPDKKLDLEEYKIFLEEALSEAKLNLEMRGSLTNKEAYQLLRMKTDWTENEKPPRPTPRGTSGDLE